MSTPPPKPRRRLPALRRVATVLAVLTLFAAGVALGVTIPWLVSVRREAIALADAHSNHDVAHPGWSFPARVWSAAAPLDLPKERLAVEAEARGYSSACPPRNPGEYCAKNGAVIPRGGWFPEGEQPPGTEGWTRPLALEPILLAVLVGPDGEIRHHLPVEDAPEHLIAAIIASEDEKFRDHPGVDIEGVGRALLANAQGGSYKQGASTLTMQVVRNLTQERDRTLDRKLREMAQAVFIDRHLGKDGVLQMYLDAPYLGQDGNFSICGFQAAARYYWGIDAGELTLSQAATLAGILPAPGRFAPDRNPEAARQRRDIVLGRLREVGWNPAEIDAALAEPVQATPHHLPAEQYPPYVQSVRAELEAKLTPEIVYGAGLEVSTGMNVAAQWQTDRIFGTRVKYLENTVGRRGEGPLLAAASLVDPKTGVLVALHDASMTASTDFNRATQARRQAGSSFKPVVYALAFQPGSDGAPHFTADHAVTNMQRIFPDTGGWRPRNVGGHYSKYACLANGLAWSHNVATATLLEELGGPKPLIRLAHEIGFDTAGFPEEMGISLGQGEVTTLEMARFAATVVGGGRYVPATAVVQATDAAGNTRVAHPGRGAPVLTPESAVLTRELMALVINYGTGGSARGGGGHPGYDGPAIGKTGTTDSEKDLWFVGATPTYAGALWLGYDQPVRIGGSASDLAAPMWGWWMRAVHEGLSREEFTGPEVDHFWICTQTGKSPVEGCRGIHAPFLDGTRPKGVCPGNHGPETGEPVEERMNLWERMAAEDDTDSPGDSDEPPAEAGEPEQPPTSP